MAPILIAGVHAAGKSTVARELSDRTNCPYFEYADFMLPLLGTRDRARILAIPFAQRGDLYRAANSAIAARFGSEHAIALGLLTIHLSLYLDGRLETFADEHYLALNVRGLLQVECDPVAVLQRRRADSDRFRHFDSLREIERQQERNRGIAQHVAELCGASLHTLDNTSSTRELSSAIAWINDLQSSELRLPLGRKGK
jgi:adenylate kinase